MPNLAPLCIETLRRRLARSFETIEHCLAQLDDDDLHWRSFEGHNSISTILLHLNGNVRQWIIAGIGRTPDTRQRALEFTDRTRYAGGELLERLCATVAEADAVLANLAPNDLTDARRIQGFDETVLSAAFGCVTHFVGHMQEITFITRMRLEDRYRFRWTPTTPEQGV